MRKPSLPRWLLVAVLGAALMSGAMAQDAKPAKPDENLQKALSVTATPGGGAPRGNVTSFTPALRCMDTQFRAFGVKNVSVIIEDIPDQTKKINVGAREMFVSATSQMTRASRAIRLIPYDGNRKVFQDLFKGQEDIMSKANFAIQGSISQFDESLMKKQVDGGICLGPLCIGGAESDSFSGMSVDMSMLNVRDDLTLIPGVISKNFVLLRKRGKGADADMNFKKFGINYNFTVSSSDGQGAAMRSLVELSAIELFGRLLKIPYWACLGVSDDDPGVKSEIEDWWDMLQSDVPSLVTYLQIQMQSRGLYKGDIDGDINDETMRAIRAYKIAMGMPDDLNLDGEFFKRYLTANHAATQLKAVEKLKEITAAEGPLPDKAKTAAKDKPTQVAAAAPAAQQTAPAAQQQAAPAATTVAAAAAAAPTAAAANAARTALSIQSAKGAQAMFKRGEAVEVEVTVANRGFLYCYLIDENRAVTQFFPNPAQPSAAMAAGTRIQFPGKFPFQLLASSKGATETIACYASAQDLGPNVQPPASVRDAAGLRNALSQRAGQQVEAGVFDVRVQ